MSVGSVSNVFPGGRPSGLPEDIVQQLVDAKRAQTVKPIEQDLQQAQQQKDVYSKLDSQLTKMKQAADGLNDSSAFQVSSATSSNSEAVSASAGQGAAEGEYSVAVDALARAHNHVLGTDGDSTEDGTVSGGIDDPNDSSLINADMELSFHHQGSQYSYSTDGETTLNSLADTISDDDNGVAANVSNTGTEDSPEYVLTFKSESTGAGENRITKDGDPTNPGVQITDTTSSGKTLFTTGATDQEETVSGQNALFSVDGVSYERTSNEVNDAIDGVTLELNQAGFSAGISVERDVEAMTEKVQSFVDEFNNTNKFISQLSEYDKEEEQAGPLMGSTLARSADSRMSRVIMEPISGTAEEPYQYLNQVGLELDREGALQFDSGAFASAMRENPEAVEKLFTGDSGAAGKMASTLNRFTDDVDGSLTYKLESIGNREDRINDRMEREQERLMSYRDRTEQKFTHMEKAISRYQSMESEVNNWISRMEE